MDSENSHLVGKLQDVLDLLGDREPSTFLEAQAVTEAIRIRKGHLDEEVHADGYRISEQLYSSKYRFLYEVIQNADDSSYSKARTESLLPYIQFDITPDSVIIETNEDGFTRANVEAICATGESSKKASADDDHIGEKGFGFKSVFSIASEVYIQSGFWSFWFQHRQRDDGLGMVTPLDAPPESLPIGVRTRITLKVSDRSPAAYQRLLDAVMDIPETTIFFLQRLRRITMRLTRTDGSTESITTKKSFQLSSRMYHISRLRVGHTRALNQSAYLRFFGTRDNMPEDERRGGRSEVRVDLAFPVHQTTKAPKLSECGQHVFAYLPLQRIHQLQFLIQSDFITAANRESIMDCPWNEAICDRVAEIFAWVVSTKFAEESHGLKYSWLEYLPTAQMEYPWRNLESRIKELLKAKPVLQTWERRQFKLPGKLRQLPGYMLHDGAPILRDLTEECYLAPEYSARHVGALKDLGVSDISWSEIIERLGADLVSTESKVKTTDATDDWHKAFAELMLLALRSSDYLCEQRIKRLAFIPLSGGIQWTGAAGTQGGLTQIFFPDTDSVPIPNSLSLHLVERTAASNVKRRELYRLMGVRDCPVETVLLKIQQMHQRSFAPHDVLNELRYLFYFHPRPEQVKSWVWVRLNGEITRKASSCSLYFPSDSEYDTYQLLPAHVRDSNRVVQFLSGSLVDLVSPTVRIRDLSWKAWLKRVMNAHYSPTFVVSTGGLAPVYSLSPVLSAILRYNPMKFLDTLKAHWMSYQSEAAAAEPALRTCVVPCKSGASLPLETTYLPNSVIISKINNLGLSETDFPLLKISNDTLDDSTCRQWQFLEQFGVASRLDLGFYKTALQVMKSSVTPMVQDKVEELYLGMARLATVEDHDNLRSFFDTESGIWDSQRCSWVSQNECIWQAPKFLNCKSVLARSYQHSPLITSFFTLVLRISDWTIDDVLGEIEKRRDDTRDNPSLTLTTSIYSFLNSNARSDEDWRTIKDAFSAKRLVLGENGSWHTRHTCVWSSAFPLVGFQDLSYIYTGLEGFFLRRMSVKKASPGMLIDEVQRMAGEADAQVSEIRLHLVKIGMMLVRTAIDASILRALDALKEVRFLPKVSADGTQTLVSVTDDFAISDHQRYADALGGRGVLLDFQVDEVQTLHIVFQHLELTNRYLSTIVKEVSRVGPDYSEIESLSQQLQFRAYALYCCAAKYKSIKALRDDKTLFDQLSNVRIYTTSEISTHLVLALRTGSLSVQSDRVFIHHEVVEDHIKIYVPAEERQRKTCYRSQLPELLASILGVDASAKFNISSIVISDLRDLDDVVREQDVPTVDWIEKPVFSTSEVSEDDHDGAPTPRSAFGDSDTGTFVNQESRPLTPRTPSRHENEYQRTPSRANVQDMIRDATPAQYTRLIEQVVQSAQRANNQQLARNIDVARTAPLDEEGDFDHVAIFGVRENNEFAHDRRIGAVGEAFVFELLSALGLPDFTRANWQSTIRGELSGATQYASMPNWTGRETADIVYTDRTGALTQYLRANCTGDFPGQIPNDHDHVSMPVQYYLEVKSTTSVCNTRFFLSSGQYKRMGDMVLLDNEPPSQVYVIFRVYNLTSPNVGFKVFVDPTRLVGTYLDFEAQQWIARTI
ncbi:Nn.00g024760.m01.CDS01 [Neocucurbitaria sp. VM-36]